MNLTCIVNSDMVRMCFGRVRASVLGESKLKKTHEAARDVMRILEAVQCLRKWTTVLSRVRVECNQCCVSVMEVTVGCHVRG